MSIEQVQMIERLRAALAPFAAAAPAYRAHRPEVLAEALRLLADKENLTIPHRGRLAA